MGRGTRRRRRRPAQVTRHRPAVEFAETLGYRFRELDRLREALTHGSYGSGRPVDDYERLEFLGDAALGLVVTEAMHLRKPTWSAQRRQETKGQVVSNQSLAAGARSLGLDEGIRVGPGQNAADAVRSSDRILANVFEAVLGAAYLDGGLAAARAVVGAAFSRKLRTLRIGSSARRGGIGATLARSARPAIARLRRFGRRALFQRTEKERALGHTFAHPDLLEEALDLSGDAPRGRTRRRSRHRGRRRPARALRSGNGGRTALRFLGRDVMHLITAEALHRAFPEWDEGRMTLARMRLQERDFTTDLARRWDMGDSDAGVGNAEAALGALYLDGGMSASRRALREPFREAFDDLGAPGVELLDAKTLLQNRLAQDGKEPPRYDVRRSSGRRNEVTVRVRLEGGIVETGRGRGLKEAEKDAAQRAYDRVYGARSRAQQGRGSRPVRRKPARTGPGDGGGRPASRRRAPSRPAQPAVDLSELGTDPKQNPKGALQELLVKRDGRLPVYRVISESGPDHDKTFVVEALCGGKPLGRGSAGSKRRAEARAAAAAISAGLGPSS